ncbi:CHAD domain-containing protein [Lusitaniella coriacea]|uniref:CHAD domain-containing protein n=1 Tax=Lusitaniella coriacea TaxID=1983105 RepID=UPI003CF35B30
MKKTTAKDAKTFGDWAYLAIAKHYKKMVKHEVGVLADQDPEELHQMRVGMRRLRSAIAGFAPALSLPKASNSRKVGKIARILGELRDLDVLSETLTQHYQPLLPQAEQKPLDRVFKTINKRRGKTFDRVKSTLEGKSYRKLKQGFTKWLEQPEYRAIAQVPIPVVLPDLLLPQVSQILLHPGWLVGAEIEKETLKVVEISDPLSINKLLENDAAPLHDLRKEAKRSRYQMELFASFYGKEYKQQLSDIKEIQTILGEIQDSFVLAEFLNPLLKSNLADRMPALWEILVKTRQEKWHDWQILQQKFLNVKTRQNLRSTVQKPTTSKVKSTRRRRSPARKKTS